MSSWKKLVTSGSHAHLQTVTASVFLGGDFSGSFSGSFFGNGSLLTGITSTVPAGTVSSSVQTISHLNGSTILSGSLVPSASYALTASYVSNVSSAGCINIQLYNGGSDLVTGIQNVPVKLPYGGTATGWEMIAYDINNNPLVSSIVVDILSDTFSALPLSGTDSIAGTQKPTLVNATSSFSSSLSSWSSLTQGNYIQSEIESVSSGVKLVLISITVSKS